jgi:hypothetical protein
MTATVCPCIFAKIPNAMKKSTPKSQAKSNKKAVHKHLKESLITGLTEIAAKHHIDSKKAVKEINKAAKHLSKSLSKEIKTEKTEKTTVVIVKQPVAAIAPKTTKQPVKKVAKPVADEIVTAS